MGGLKTNTKLLENIFALSTLKAAEYIINFITLPYLLHILGASKYGSIIFSQTVINYGILLTDYGFNLTAPRDIANAPIEKIKKEFSSIYFAKILLLMLVVIGSIVVIETFTENIDKMLLLCVLPNLFGNVLFPVWYFQGVQKMKFITVFNLGARMLSVCLIFVLVDTSDDYYIAAFLLSITPLIAGIAAVLYLVKKNNTLFLIPSFYDVKQKMIEGWDVFVSTFFINLYTNTNMFILGCLTNDTVLGYYAAASKLIDAVKGLMQPISNAIFPYVSKLFVKSRSEAIFFLSKVVRLVSFVNLSVSILIFVFAEQIVYILMGDGYKESVILLKVISILPFVIGLSNIFGIQTMLAFGMQKIFSRILFASAIVNFLLVFPLIYFFEALGLAVTVVLVEVFVTITMYIVLLKNNIILKL